MFNKESIIKLDHLLQSYYIVFLKNLIIHKIYHMLRDTLYKKNLMHQFHFT